MRPPRIAKLGRLIAYAVAAYAILAMLAPGVAGAHPISTTAILLEPGPEKVTGSVQLPLDRLEVALDERLTASSVKQPAKLE